MKMKFKKKFWVCRKTVLGNVIRKLHTKLHRASLINKCFKIGENKSLTKKQKILFRSIVDALLFVKTFNYGENNQPHMMMDIYWP